MTGRGAVVDQAADRSASSSTTNSTWSCPTKTLITHGRTQAARFLGYEIVVLHAGHKYDQRGHRSISATTGLKVPVDVIAAKCKPYLHHGKPVRRTERIVNTDFSIVTQFQAELVVKGDMTSRFGLGVGQTLEPGQNPED
ncbi:MAG: hypothetical protein JXA67_15660 [Micromonosporaceae bacterium]|nr:hypothetical protein [Micromonosporaceae bacterium]